MPIICILDLYEWIVNYSNEETPSNYTILHEIRRCIKNNLKTQRHWSSTVYETKSNIDIKFKQKRKKKKCNRIKNKYLEVDKLFPIIKTKINRPFTSNSIINLTSFPMFRRSLDSILSSSSSSDESNCSKESINNNNDNNDGIFIINNSSSLYSLASYIENILLIKCSKLPQNLDNDKLYIEANIPCFLIFWKQFEDCIKFKNYYLNEYISLWQQLRDVLLLTGLSLKYPTWSGYQLSNIINRVIPEKILLKENYKLNNNMKLEDPMIYGFNELNYFFLNHPDDFFDLNTVSKLIQEELKKITKLINEKNAKIPCVDIELDMNKTSSNVIINSNDLSIVPKLTSNNGKLCNYIERTSLEFTIPDTRLVSFDDTIFDNYILNKEDLNNYIRRLSDRIGLMITRQNIERVINHNKFQYIRQLNNQNSNKYEYSLTILQQCIQKLNIVDNIMKEQCIYNDEIFTNFISNIGDSSRNCMNIAEKINNLTINLLNNDNNNDSDNDNNNNNNDNNLHDKKIFIQKSYNKSIFWSFLFIFLFGILFIITSKNKIIISSNIKNDNIEDFKGLNFYENIWMRSSDCLLAKWEYEGQNINICDVIGDIIIIHQCFTII
ncbi:uncharacterized protein CMU_003650 [Cryptosporidium muris RN66]|uniref:Uncharacterized protein n=1 Tax=Cryptosporidium muris (strain RN66) TaxID=441375 RepID=B6AJY5_CRYMR|nr:uncharacterized protein CMU_003650 [Cryptosporidium muris RN66]EEA08526.1 hypothetical protein, conserved [Cryptosporidium muris RN66]|eukprot:XP_002142875.1 hypothetical protein [Cryptosporidium muris RN66]